ncbi:RibD family protein [Candidatus Daviesbacteria bacterium]|nr:RibD family protein [Candidatus Daviesbacteria bacterium]
MVYPNLKFPKISQRPFFYTNFVQTLDGKVSVLKNGYWPIGSLKDHKVLLELRAYADCLIHGSNLAFEFGERTLESLGRSEFGALRKRLGKNKNLPYFVVTSKAGKFEALKVNTVSNDIKSLTTLLFQKGFNHVLVEGGPTILGSFLKEGLMDEIFITIAPKIFGTAKNATKTLVEGILLPPEKIKNLKLLSVKKLDSEVFLRYRVLS